MIYKIFDPAVDLVGQIATSYATANVTATRAWRVTPGSYITVYGSSTGGGNLYVQLSYAPFTDGITIPSAQTDSNWFNATDITGGSPSPVTGQQIVIPAGNQFVVHYTGVSSTGDGIPLRVPAGMGYIRTRVRTQSAGLTALSLTMIVDAPFN